MPASGHICQPHRKDARQQGKAAMYLGFCFKGRNNWRLAQRNFEEAMKHLPATEEASRKEVLYQLAQGCADAGLCYPPVTKTVRVSLPPGRAPSGSTGAARDVSSLKGGLTWLNWCQVHDVDPLHAPRADVETWWNDINTATSLGTSTRLLMVRAMSSWNLWTVREKHANVAYGAWVDQIGTVK